MGNIDPESQTEESSTMQKQGSAHKGSDIVPNGKKETNFNSLIKAIEEKFLLGKRGEGQNEFFCKHSGGTRHCHFKGLLGLDLLLIEHNKKKYLET